MTLSGDSVYCRHLRCPDIDCGDITHAPRCAALFVQPYLKWMQNVHEQTMSHLIKEREARSHKESSSSLEFEAYMTWGWLKRRECEYAKAERGANGTLDTDPKSEWIVE